MPSLFEQLLDFLRALSNTRTLEGFCHELHLKFRVIIDDFLMSRPLVFLAFGDHL